MEKTARKFWMALPVAAVAVALGGCGGGGNDDSSPASGSNGSITDCFTVSKTVSFSLTSFNVPSGQIFPSRSTAGPMTYNGQAVIGQTVFYLSGNTTYTESDYWMVANNGVILIADVDYNGVATVDGTVFPQNMSPGQTASDSSNDDISTFVGFETLSLAGKTFSNTCHFTAGQADAWFAPGYGMIKRIINGGTWQYSGSL